MSLIDVHTHFLPSGYRDLLEDWGKSVRIDEDGGRPRIHHSHGTIPMTPGFTDVTARLDWMDDHDVETTLVSVSTPNPNEGPFTPEESTRLVRAINDGYADLQAEFPSRIAGLGMVPLRDPDAALTELDRIAKDLDLAGVALPTAVRDRKLSHPDLEPVFDRIDELDLTVFVHPRPNSICDELGPDEWAVTPTAVFPSETTIQLTRLILDGFFDRHAFDLVVAHLGGTLPYLAGRLERGREVFATDDDTPARPVASYLGEFYYDVISFHPPAIRAAIETVGPGQFVFGTDYPFGIEDADATIAAVEAALDDTADAADVYEHTAADVFDL
jgi:aminocarboxymuconate-semialdehyde decarboxylase